MAPVPNSSTQGLGVELRIAYSKVVGTSKKNYPKVPMNDGDVFFMGSNPWKNDQLNKYKIKGKNVWYAMISFYLPEMVCFFSGFRK